MLFPAHQVGQIDGLVCAQEGAIVKANICYATSAEHDLDGHEAVNRELIRIAGIVYFKLQRRERKNVISTNQYGF